MVAFSRQNIAKPFPREAPYPREARRCKHLSEVYHGFLTFLAFPVFLRVSPSVV